MFKPDMERAILEVCTKGYQPVLGYSNVVGVAKGTKVVNNVDTKEMCLSFLVEKKLPKNQLSSYSIVPEKYNGVKTDVIEVGRLQALNLADRTRPALSGYSVGVPGHGTGTIGCIVYAENDGVKVYYILSNNHVLAGENSVERGAYVLQPAPMDGGNYRENIIGRMARYVPIQFSNFNGSIENNVDCALAKVNPSTVSRRVPNVGNINGIAKAQLNDDVKKIGRTTGYTTGTVLLTNATAVISYVSGEALFTNQILTTPMCKPGDSGSLLLNSRNQAVGLVFAGSEKASMANDFATVLEMLNVAMA